MADMKLALYLPNFRDHGPRPVVHAPALAAVQRCAGIEDAGRSPPAQRGDHAPGERRLAAAPNLVPTRSPVVRQESSMA